MKNPRWPTLRAAAQLLVWLCFAALVVSMRFPVDEPGLYRFVPRLSIHLGTAASLSSGSLLISFLPALALLFAALVAGRFFCGWICPLGSTLDATDKVFCPGASRSEKERPVRARRYKYLVLGSSLALAAAGIMLAGIIDPLSLVMRGYIVLYSYLDSLVRMPFNAVGAVIPVFLADTVLDTNSIAFDHHYVIILMFLGILVLSRVTRRFWCRYLCPLGAAYALVSKFALIRRRVDREACTGCLACERDCPMNAIGGSGLYTAEDECVKCFTCLKSCRYGAVSFGFGLPAFRKKAAAPGPGSITRRDLLATLAATSVAIPFAAMNPDSANASTFLIRPPGAGKEKEFLDLCVRCGECLKVCPTNGLHPALAEAGLEGIFSPRLVPRIGWCVKNCNLCTLVCPTGALREVALEERETLIMGTAVIYRDLCIPWSEDRNCIVCEEMCPTATKSIKFLEETVVREDGTRGRVKRPYVLEEICIGCGICENKCPVRGDAAIRVRRKKREGTVP